MSIQLYMTSDLGKRWDPVAQYVNFRFYWAVPGVDKVESTVHMEIQDPTTGWCAMFVLFSFGFTNSV